MEYVNRLKHIILKLIAVVVVKLKESAVYNFYKYLKALGQAKPYNYQHLLDQIMFIETYPYLKDTAHIYEKMLK